MRLDPVATFGEGAGIMDKPTPRRPRRILWQNVLTVVSAAILISAEVFGAAFAGSWAIASLLALGTLGARVLDVLFILCGIFVMAQFVRAAHRIEPFTAD
jgi:hypothetical protein